MRCPFCGNDDTQVKDSRPAEDHSAIRRRRFCPGCGSRFTTFERVQLRELTVAKKNGELVVVSRNAHFTIQDDDENLHFCIKIEHGCIVGWSVHGDDGIVIGIRKICHEQKRKECYQY